MILKIIPVGNTATVNCKNPDIVFRWKGQGFLLLPTDHVSLGFFLKKITIACNTFLYKPGRKITSSGNGMCRQAASQVDDYRTCTQQTLVSFKCRASLPFAPNPFTSKFFVFKVTSHLLQIKGRRKNFPVLRDQIVELHQVVLENRLALI